MRKEKYSRPLMEEIELEAMEMMATSGEGEESLNVIESDNGAVLSKRRGIWD